MLTLPRAFIDEMIAHALEDAPNECCGIIAAAALAAGGFLMFREESAGPA